MKHSELLQHIKEQVTDILSYNGDKNTIHNRLVHPTPKESVGVISSIMTTNNTVYAIIKRSTDDDCDSHSGVNEYYNCKGDVNMHSPYELYVPLINIHLNKDKFNPQSLIGGKVLVRELKGTVLKAEYIGELTEVNESPSKVSRSVLQSFRNMVGDNVSMTDTSPDVLSALSELDITQDMVKKLNKYSVSDLEGNIVRFDADAPPYRDVMKQINGEFVINNSDNDSIGQLIKHVNQKDMKTQECHLPTTLFSAR